MTITAFVWTLDTLSVLVFALTGALVASRKQLDMAGFLFMAALTAVGGGTVRDLVLNRDPVFWVAEPELIVMASVAAVVVFWTAPLLESRYRWILWLDALAVSIAVPAGVGVALDGGFGPVVIVIAGVLTGCFGGLLRDVVGNQVPLVLKQRELYLTAAFGGALAGMSMTAIAPRPVALLVCGVVTFILRGGSLRWNWALPGYRARPPRN